MWYVYTMGYYSVIERNQLFMCAVTWINLRINMLSERIQTQKMTNCIFSFTWNFRKGTLPASHNHRSAFCPYYLIESRSVITWNWVWHKELLPREKWKPLGMVKMSWVSNVTVVSQVYLRQNSPVCTLYVMHLIIFELYLNKIDFEMSLRHNPPKYNRLF